MNKSVLVLTAVVVLLGGAGGAFGVFMWWQNKPDPRGFAHPLETVPKEERVALVEHCEKVAESDEILGKVVDELNLVSRLEVGDREAAIERLRELAYVDLSGDQSAMHFMVKGKRKERAFVEEMARSLYVATLDAVSRRENEF